MKKKAPTLRELYPNLTDDQLEQVEDTWERYLALVLRIYDRLVVEHGEKNVGKIIADSRAKMFSDKPY